MEVSLKLGKKDILRMLKGVPENAELILFSDHVLIKYTVSNELDLSANSVEKFYKPMSDEEIRNRIIPEY